MLLTFVFSDDAITGSIDDTSCSDSLYVFDISLLYTEPEIFLNDVLTWYLLTKYASSLYFTEQSKANVININGCWYKKLDLCFDDRAEWKETADLICLVFITKEGSIDDVDDSADDILGLNSNDIPCNALLSNGDVHVGLLCKGWIFIYI